MHFFLHIQKTGGQTLGARLAAGFAPDRTSVMRRDIASRDELHAMARQHDFVAGHPGPGSLVEPPPGVQVLSLVRDPVETIISLYRHIRRDPLNPLHAAAAALPARTCIERFEHLFFNFQSRVLTQAWTIPSIQALSRGEEAWLARQVPDAADAVRWLVPSERMDEFCALWRLETGRAV
ncbi:MAG: hypothetical protein K2X74_15980, partial [Acetobacteraceae bacterium]|nr:hypothetical protein [Acetobacteraceae bacterium]